MVLIGGLDLDLKPCFLSVNRVDPSVSPIGGKLLIEDISTAESFEV